MTPRDQMSQERSYFLDPNTSGAEKERFKNPADKLAWYKGRSLNALKYETGLTNIVGSVARCFQTVLSMSFFGKPKVCQLQCPFLS